MSVLRALTLTISLFVVGPLCLAQSGEPGQSTQTQSPEPQSAPPTQTGNTQTVPHKQYQVEIIAFRYLGPDSSNGEEFNRVDVEDYLPKVPFDPDRYNKLQQTISYTAITHLSDALKRLHDDPRFSVLLATAWVQPLLNKSDAIDVPLGDDQGSGQAASSEQQSTGGNAGQGAQGGVQPDSQGLNEQSDQGGAPVTEPAGSDDTSQQDAQGVPGFSGTMRVYGDHFLYVDLKLNVTVPKAGQGAGAADQSPGETTGNVGDMEATPGNGLTEYHISEVRRIKLDEVQYFDHPYIGAIVSVTRYQGPPPDQGSLGTQGGQTNTQDTQDISNQ